MVTGKHEAVMGQVQTARLTFLGFLATLGVVAALPPTALAGGFESCGTQQPSIFVTAYADNVSCRIARRVAKKYVFENDRNPLGFSCRDPRTKSSGEAFVGRCKRGNQRVKIDYGV